MRTDHESWLQLLLNQQGCNALVSNVRMQCAACTMVHHEESDGGKDRGQLQEHIALKVRVNLRAEVNVLLTHF